MAELTDEQAALADEVLKLAGITGADCKDLLHEVAGGLADKVAVAEYLGGPGAGSTFLLDDTSTRDDHDTDEA